MPGKRGDPSTKPPPFDPGEFAKASEHKIRAAEQHQHTATTIEGKMPSLSARPRVVMSEEDMAWLELSESARILLAHLDGETTVHALMEAKLVDVDALFSALEELEREGVIVLASRAV